MSEVDKAGRCLSPVRGRILLSMRDEADVFGGLDMKYKPGLQRRMWLGTVWLGHTESDLDQEAPQDIIFSVYRQWYVDLTAHVCVDFARAQIEISDTGAFHLQVAVHTTDSKRWSWMAKHLPANWEPARNWGAVANYCKKSDSRIERLPDYGEMPEKSQGGSTNGSLKLQAITALKCGRDPQWIALNMPEVYFVHHRAIDQMYRHVYMAWRGGVVEEE